MAAIEVPHPRTLTEQQTQSGFGKSYSDRSFNPLQPVTRFCHIRSPHILKARNPPGFRGGYQAGQRWLYDPANREQAIQVLVDKTRLSPDDARATYELYIDRDDFLEDR